MKNLQTILVVVPALLLVSGLAFAQRRFRFPPGSYQQTCSDIRFDGRTLTARCLDKRGRRVRTSMARPDRCRRDIANINGTLMCR